MIRSIQCFSSQTYKNKELIIINDGDIESFRKLKSLVSSTPNVYPVFIGKKYNLGQLRNISLEYASGEILCQWDDDDLNHPERLERQYSKMLSDASEVSFFMDQLHFFYRTTELYWVEWHQFWKGEYKDKGYIPGTIMCRKYCMNSLKYPEIPIGEDAVLRNTLIKTFNISELIGEGWLYTYTYNGLNTFDENHHRLEIIEGKKLLDIGRLDKVHYQYLLDIILQ